MSRARRQRLLVAVVAVGGGGVGWLPWLRVGGGRRDSYGLFRAAQSFGFDELAPVRVVWYLVPVLAAACLLTLATRRRRVALVLLGTESLILLGVGLTVVRSTPGAGIKLGVGPWASLLVGGLGLALTALAALTVRVQAK